MYFFRTKQSGKGWNSPQKCHSNLWGVLKLSARLFHLEFTQFSDLIHIRIKA